MAWQCSKVPARLPLNSAPTNLEPGTLPSLRATPCVAHSPVGVVMGIGVWLQGKVKVVDH